MDLKAARPGRRRGVLEPFMQEPGLPGGVWRVPGSMPGGQGQRACLPSALPVLGPSSTGSAFGGQRGVMQPWQSSCIPSLGAEPFRRPWDPGWGRVRDGGVGQPRAQLYCDPGPLSTDRAPRGGASLSLGASPLL